MPAAASRTSFIAERPHEEGLLVGDIPRDGLSDIEPVNEKRALVGSRQAESRATGSPER